MKFVAIRKNWVGFGFNVTIYKSVTVHMEFWKWTLYFNFKK